MRIHVPSLPHTQVNEDFVWCAYTSKVRRLAKMMDLAGISMFLYAGELTDAETKGYVAEDVEVVWPADRLDWFGAEQWPDGWIFNLYDSTAPHWEETNRRVAQQIAARWEDGDILGIIAGICQASIGRLLLENHGITAPQVEWGIGYTGVFAPYRVFESYAHRHHVAGMQHDDEYRPQDEVIPNAFDPLDFILREPGDWTGAEGYLLYLGRMTPRKGLATVRKLAADPGRLVFTAGQGEERVEGAHHLGVVRGMDKAALLRNARAVLVPTTYCEPFGGVAVEAMMAGTPAITTDWGAFTETVPPHYRCATDAEFRAAVDRARRENRPELQQRATACFGVEAVSARYAAYFHRVLDHFGSR